MTPPLAPVLLMHLPAASREAWAQHASLETQLGQLLAAARAAWPGVRVTDVDFLRHLAERLGTGEARALTDVHAADLYLVLGCLQGDAVALAAFDRRVLPQVSAALARVAPGDDAEEVRQSLRERLLVGQPPKLAGYQGSGPLVAWLRAAAVRTALNLRRTEARQAAAEDEALVLESLSADDLELRHLQQRHAEDVRRALREAFAALSPRERTLLRLHVVDGLSLERIGAMYQAHKSTVSRWMAKAHETLWEVTRQQLAERLRLSAGELDSLLRLVRSQLDVSLASLL